MTWICSCHGFGPSDGTKSFWYVARPVGDLIGVPSIARHPCILAGNHVSAQVISLVFVYHFALHTMTPPSPSRTDSSMLGKLLQGASLGRSTTATRSIEQKGTCYARGMDIFAPRVPQGRTVVRTGQERERACNVNGPEFTMERRLEIQRWCEAVAAASRGR
ncbi:hypothetical protein L226DRAFT_11360 [Lentinus tigrinus ALCF2SS1-7]|uniref:uncharacterized protein n=1 Tax=Lentinus tigrinus ALCF2SS1-7 TaxID=1328758 RepID=UPI001165DB24|nr:hypothetical protein L226DRAFT_11360 [Lentinus tigrinus ALCF2SS1-7]